MDIDYIKIMNKKLLKLCLDRSYLAYDKLGRIQYNMDFWDNEYLEAFRQTATYLELVEDFPSPEALEEALGLSLEDITSKLGGLDLSKLE